MANKVKAKTHKGASKVFKVKPNGTVAYKHANKNHKTGKSKASVIRRGNEKATLSASDIKRLKSQLDCLKK